LPAFQRISQGSRSHAGRGSSRACLLESRSRKTESSRPSMPWTSPSESLI
jgi:hypothetical protein